MSAAPASQAVQAWHRGAEGWLAHAMCERAAGAVCCGAIRARSGVSLALALLWRIL